MKRFAKTIVKVLVAYVNIVKEEFPQVVQDERIVSSYALNVHIRTVIDVGTGYIGFTVGWQNFRSG